MPFKAQVMNLLWYITTFFADARPPGAPAGPVVTNAALTTTDDPPHDGRTPLFTYYSYNLWGKILE